MSDFSQQSFVGGMNLVIDATRLTDKEYRLGLNVRNRYDSLDPIPTSHKDPAIPAGIKQEMVTFGNYVICFIAGSAYYRFYSDTGWIKIEGFAMNAAAPRYWTVAVPVGLTNYGRLAAPDSLNLPTILLAGTQAGNISGLLVQDNITQPQFIFLDSSGFPAVRITQTYEEWDVVYGDSAIPPVETEVAADIAVLMEDNREYVPIGNTMTWTDGVLYIASQDGTQILRSVSGRPLDFVVNVQPNGQKGGDATTTSYSVGVSGITCLRAMSTGGVFVSASNATFLVQKNMTENSPKVFGEYTFIRQFLFNATNLSDRTIIDSLGDTRFIDLTGVRSFNAIEQLQNEGRNSIFTAKIQPIFGSLVQDYRYTAAILYNNFEFYAINTILGPVIAVYDTLTQSWSSFDTTQVNGKRIKQFAKIELTIQRLYAITEDDNLYELYSGTELATSVVRTSSINHTENGSNGIYRVNNPRYEVKLQEVRILLDSIYTDASLTIQPFVNNRLSAEQIETKEIGYVAPPNLYTGPAQLGDTNSMVYNALFTTLNCEQGWSTYVIITWSGGHLSQYSMRLEDLTPLNPTNSQKS